VCELTEGREQLHAAGLGVLGCAHDVDMAHDVNMAIVAHRGFYPRLLCMLLPAGRVHPMVLITRPARPPHPGSYCLPAEAEKAHSRQCNNAQSLAHLVQPSTASQTPRRPQSDWGGWAGLTPSAAGSHAGGFGEGGGQSGRCDHHAAALPLPRLVTSGGWVNQP
jgi:hypothetical protein